MQIRYLRIVCASLFVAENIAPWRTNHSYSMVTVAAAVFGPPCAIHKWLIWWRSDSSWNNVPAITKIPDWDKIYHSKTSNLRVLLSSRQWYNALIVWLINIDSDEGRHQHGPQRYGSEAAEWHKPVARQKSPQRSFMLAVHADTRVQCMGVIFITLAQT